MTRDINTDRRRLRHILDAANDIMDESILETLEQ
jgi:hypothetical protein